MKIRSVFVLMVVSFIVILMVSSANATADTAQGSVSKVIGSIVFLDAPEQPAYHSIGESTLSELVGKSVSIIYHAEGNRNIIDSLQVIHE
jgi:hypothetical protein